MAPSIRVTLGTDASVEPKGDTNNYEFKYEPNFNWGITETWFNGEITVNTAGKEVKYSKTFDLDSLAIKCNGVYDYDNNVPYFGFKVLTTSGVSSPANSNGFSVCKKFRQNVGPIKATADVQTSVALGTYTPPQNPARFFLRFRHLRFELFNTSREGFLTILIRAMHAIRPNTSARLFAIQKTDFYFQNPRRAKVQPAGEENGLLARAG